MNSAGDTISPIRGCIYRSVSSPHMPCHSLAYRAGRQGSVHRKCRCTRCTKSVEFGLWGGENENSVICMTRNEKSEGFQVYFISWWFEMNLWNVRYETGLIPGVQQKQGSQVDITTAIVVWWFWPVLKWYVLWYMIWCDLWCGDSIWCDRMWQDDMTWHDMTWLTWLTIDDNRAWYNTTWFEEIMPSACILFGIRATGVQLKGPTWAKTW